MNKPSLNLKPVPSTLTRCKQTICDITSHFVVGQTVYYENFMTHALTTWLDIPLFSSNKWTFLSVPWGNLTNPQNHRDISTNLSKYLTMFLNWMHLILCLTQHYKTRIALDVWSHNMLAFFPPQHPEFCGVTFRRPCSASSPDPPSRASVTVLRQPLVLLCSGRNRPDGCAATFWWPTAQLSHVLLLRTTPTGLHPL